MALRDQQSGAGATVSDVHNEAKQKTVWRNQKKRHRGLPFGASWFTPRIHQCKPGFGIFFIVYTCFLLGVHEELYFSGNTYHCIAPHCVANLVYTWCTPYVSTSGWASHACDSLSTVYTGAHAVYTVVPETGNKRMTGLCLSIKLP